MRGGVHVFSVTRLGDLVMATAVLESLRQRHGSLTLVTAPAVAPLLEGDARVDRLDPLGGVKAPRWQVEILARLARARAEGARVVSLELYEPRWRLVRRVSRLLGLRAAHLDLPALRAQTREAEGTGDGSRLRHMSGFYAGAAGVDGPAPPPVLVPPPAARRRVGARLDGLGCGPGGVVVVHPGSSPGWTAKRADADVYASAVRRLLEQGVVGPGEGGGEGAPPGAVVLVGSGEEAPLHAEVTRGLEPQAPVASWAGALDLQELAALLSGARLFMGNDSGPLKVAEAVGAPTVSLWGPTWPEQLAPRGDGHRIVRLPGSLAARGGWIGGEGGARPAGASALDVPVGNGEGVAGALVEAVRDLLAGVPVEPGGPLPGTGR